MPYKTAHPYNRLNLYLIKPSKYDDDGYVIRYWKSVLPSNTLACLNGLSEDLRRRNLLGYSEKLGYKLKEVDVTWKNEDTSISKQKSFVGESIDMVKQIIQVKINDLTGKYDQK